MKKYQKQIKKILLEISQNNPQNVMLFRISPVIWLVGEKKHNNLWKISLLDHQKETTKKIKTVSTQKIKKIWKSLQTSKITHIEKQLLNL